MREKLGPSKVNCQASCPQERSHNSSAKSNPVCVYLLYSQVCSCCLIALIASQNNCTAWETEREWESCVREREGEVLKGGRESRSNPVRLKPLYTFLPSVHRVLLKIDPLPDSSPTNPPKTNSFCHSQSCHFVLKGEMKKIIVHIKGFHVGVLTVMCVKPKVY